MACRRPSRGQLARLDLVAQLLPRGLGIVQDLVELFGLRGDSPSSFAIRSRRSCSRSLPALVLPLPRLLRARAPAGPARTGAAARAPRASRAPAAAAAGRPIGGGRARRCRWRRRRHAAAAAAAAAARAASPVVGPRSRLPSRRCRRWRLAPAEARSSAARLLSASSLLGQRRQLAAGADDVGALGDHRHRRAAPVTIDADEAHVRRRAGHPSRSDAGLRRGIGQR